MPDITYRFVASGQQDVEKAFTGIERAAVRQKQAVEQATRATSRRVGRGSPEDRRYKEVERAAAKYERDMAREAKVAERAEVVKARIADRAAIARARSEERAQRYVARIRDRHFADEQRKGEKAAQDRIKQAEKEANKRQAVWEAAAKRERQAKDRANNEAAAKRKQSIGVLKDLAGGAFLGAVGAGGALIGSAARESMQLQEASARIAISARGAGQEARNPDELRRGFERTAMATPGQSAAGVADAVARFVSLTGDLDTAVKSQGTFATIASASGANIGDVAEAAASLSQQFDVKGIDDMREALAALTFQGKNGAFELKDAAAQFQRLAASGASFGIPKGVGGVKVLGGLTQIARTGTGSAEQASTAVENLLTNLKVKQTQLGAAGVKVFDKSGQARDVRDLIVESISKVGGNDMARKNAGLAQIFGEQGIRAINPLIAKYSETFRSTKGTDAEKTAAAVARLRDEFTKAIDAPGTYADAQEDAAMAQQQASAQLSAAWEALKAKTADALIPSLGKLAESLAGKESLLDPFIEAVGLAAEAVVWFANATGFKKKKTKAEELADAQNALDKYKRANGITDTTAGPVSPEQRALEDKVTAAHDALWGVPAGGGKSKADFASTSDFVTQYMNANPETADADVQGMINHARDIAAGGGLANNDWWMKNFGFENDAQADLRKRYAAQVQGQSGAGSEIDTKGASEALQSFAATITAVNAKIAAAGGPQGSIVSGV